MEIAGREKWWMRFGSNNGVDKKIFFIRINPAKTSGDWRLVKIWEIKNPGFLYPRFQLTYQTQN